MGSVASALQHCCYRSVRRRMLTLNGHQKTTALYPNQRIRQWGVSGLLPEKRRKDAVLAVEYVMTASPEWWKEATPRQQAEFFARSEQWLEKKYGKDRVVAAVVHRDEATHACQRSWCH